MKTGEFAPGSAGRPGAGRTEPAAATPASRLPAIILPLVVALLGFTLLQAATELVATDKLQLIPVWSAVVLVATLALAPARPSVLPDFAQVLLRSAAVFVLVYFAIEPFDAPYAALPPDHVAVRFHQVGRWVGLALALLALWRPGFLFAAAMQLWMLRELQTALTGFYYSTLDIRIVAEIIAFAAIGLSLLALAVHPRRAARLGLDAQATRDAALVIVAAAIGAHVGNYFWSALAKLALDGGALSWLLDNRLADGMPGALEKGTLPMAAWPWLTEAVYRIMLALAVPLNLLAWCIQVAGPLALRQRRRLMTLTIGFDLFHLGVFLALGLLFWKWMALNLIILATLAAIGDDEWRRLGSRVALVFVVIGAIFFRTASLAWYDSPGFASPYFVAHLDDGRSIRLPSSTFGSASYQVSQAKFWSPPGHGHFNPSIWGSVLHWEDLVAGRTCRPPRPGQPAAAAADTSPGDVGRYMRAAHRALLARTDAAGHLPWRFVPHHHVPSAGLPYPLAGVDVRRITGYDYVVDSVCLGITDGRLTRRVVAHSALPVYDAVHDTIVAP